jgi:hypothetical protein
MKWAVLKAELRREVLSPGFERVFVEHAPGLRVLARLDGPQALLAALEAAEPFGPELDALLADLLRLRLRCPHPAVGSAVLYALRSQWGRLYRCIAAAVENKAERKAAVFAMVLERAERFDPEQRSGFVLAGLATDARRELGVLRQRELRQVLAGSEPLDGSDEVVPPAMRVPGAELLLEVREALQEKPARKGRRRPVGRRSILCAETSARSA